MNGQDSHGLPGGYILIDIFQRLLNYWIRYKSSTIAIGEPYLNE
jgi:hypothetical protein